MEYFAHSLTDSFGRSLPTTKWEPLRLHLESVADRAAQFASVFSAEDWGRLTGLWHDLGKYSSAFQAYLMKENGYEAHLEQYQGRVDHSTAGAQHAYSTIPGWGRILAYVIAGHHAGLSDAKVSPSSLESRLRKEIEPIAEAAQELLSPGISLGIPSLQIDQNDPQFAGFQLAFFTRMLFSCLVDADFLCTEEFMSPEKSRIRPSQSQSFPDMKRILDQLLENKAASATKGIVFDCRQEVLTACREAGFNSPGLFSLTVPTGGGKTLSSLAFALEHAIQYNRSRIIYAIPFTSIIEQTANVFRDVFCDLESEIVLEHHSNLDPDSEHESPRSRLAAENWDAPLVVTTNVQLFESLFAARTSRCRKLHNLVNSVIILDEVQTLPVDRLRPCISALDELAKNYHCSIVLCTATQPAIKKDSDFPIGLSDVREIVPDPPRLYRRMKRVSVKKLGSLSDEELLDQLVEHRSFLAIVNTRAHAAKLYRELQASQQDEEGLYHLSTLMCGEHRSYVIAKIRERLASEQPTRVISTQLIEAGVDVDFPLVFRAMTGLDSIAQAAGRCNREGRLSSGTVYVFEPKDVNLFGYLRSVAQTAGEVAPNFEDLLDPVAIHQYFKLHYWKQEGENQWDKTKALGVMNCFPFTDDFPFDFRTAAERFCMIEENGRTIFVPYKPTGPKLIEQLRIEGADRRLLRKLQRYTVTLYEHLFEAMFADLELVHDQFPVLSNPSTYDEKLGVRIDRPGYREPDQLIC